MFLHNETEWLKEEIRRNELNKPNGTNLKELISRFLLLVDVDSLPQTQEDCQIDNDKTLSAITFTLAMLANHQDVQQRLYEEITLKTDEVYLNAVIREVLRLYPPVATIERILGEETIVGENKFVIEFLSLHLKIILFGIFPCRWCKIAT